MVIGPTPPGTGVINEHFGATSSNLTSPVSLKPDFFVESGTRVVPTSITTAPSFTISAFTKLGCPNACLLYTSDTLNSQYLSILNLEIQANVKLENYKTVINLQKDITAIKDSIYQREKQNAALELDRCV